VTPYASQEASGRKEAGQEAHCEEAHVGCEEDCPQGSSEAAQDGEESGREEDNAEEGCSEAQEGGKAEASKEGSRQEASAQAPSGEEEVTVALVRLRPCPPGKASVLFLTRLSVDPSRIKAARNPSNWQVFSGAW